MRLEGYAGTYRNIDTNASLKVTVQGDQLVFSGDNALSWTMRQLYEDAFQADGWSAWTAVFSKRRNQVDTFSLFRTRTRNLKFDRVY